MVQTTEARYRNHGRIRCSSLLDGPFVRSVFFQRVMHPVLMVVDHVITQEPEQMAFVPHNDMVQISGRQLPTQRSAMPFCQGDWMLALVSDPLSSKTW